MLLTTQSTPTAVIGFTEAIALIGCITGCISLAISLRDVWTQRFALKIEFHERENMFFSKLPSQKEIHTVLQGVIRLRLINNSSTPFTAYSCTASVDRKNAIVRPAGIPTFCLLTHKYADGRSAYIEVNMDKQLVFPLRIEPYDAVEGYLFMPFYPDTEKNKQTITITIATAKGKKSAKSVITRITPIIE